MAADKETNTSSYFEALYLKRHPKKFDPKRAALLKRLKNKKKKVKKHA